jgi:phosphoribosyl 1,2-cyclic phosphodiesterase/DNA-binding response OmpR family regulator
MRVQFWGTRGSIPTPGPGTVRYGGNTACVSVRTRKGTLIVTEPVTTERRGHLLIGHTHWDHIQGFPYFAPLFQTDQEWDVYAPRGFGPSLRETLAGQMQYNYFPVNLDQLGATIRYHDLIEDTFMIEEVRVTARYLNHPALTLGYRLEADGITLVYASDHECHTHASALGAPLGQILRSLHPGEQRHQNFIAAADLLIHDTQYIATEYPRHAGWGHSTMEYVVDLAVAGGVRQLALFHHDPRRDDAALDAVVTSARERVAATGASTTLFAAAEGDVVEIDAPARPMVGASPVAQAQVDTTDLVLKPVLVVSTDPALAHLLGGAVQAEGLQVVAAASAQDALRRAHAEPLALAIVARRIGDADGPALLRALRAREGQAQLPGIVVASATDPAAVDATPASAGGSGADPAITEWVIAPCSRQYLRTKLQAAILRTRTRWRTAAAPPDEDRRLAALRQLDILDSAPEERFDRITRLAAQMFRVPIALISLVDADRQWFKSRTGLQAQQTSRDESFCAHAILDTHALVVPDAMGDDRFADNPLVCSEPRVRFYAGQPIAAPDGSLVGTLCLIDHQPRHFAQDDIEALCNLAAMVERELDAAH